MKFHHSLTMIVDSNSSFNTKLKFYLCHIVYNHDYRFSLNFLVCSPHD
jgi:hypothetical protein